MDLIDLRLNYGFNEFDGTFVHVLNIAIINEEKETFFLHSIELFISDLNPLIQNINKVLGPPIWKILRQRNARFQFMFNQRIVETHEFQVKIIVRKFINNEWSHPFHLEWGPIAFQTKPLPIFKAFISRSIRENENQVPELITEFIRKWGFTTSTMGISPFNSNYSDEDLLNIIKQEISKSDIIFAIATKRDKMANNYSWRTFEWLQSEASMGFALDKQVLVFVEKSIEISGLASKRVILSFDSNKLGAISDDFDKIMPQIRANVQNRRNSVDLLNFLKGCSIVFGGLITMGLGYLIGKEDKNGTTRNGCDA